MSNATAMGMATVFQVMPAERAVVMTGATISATTAGRIPLKIRDTIALFLITSGVRKMAIARIIKKEGKMVPIAAVMLPFKPFR